MSDLLAARSQMGISLGFHIIFAAIGIAMPFLMAIAHWKWLKTRNQAYLALTKAWSRGVAIFFAVGAVSGTVLSFELGLLWPGFMEIAGPIIGMPFSLEGTAFFLEAIALAVFLYGWERVPKWVHWASGLVVGVTGVFSGLFVVTANAWMNGPSGFDWIGGQARNIDPWRAMFNHAATHECIHMTLAAFEATGIAVAGVHAIGLLKNPRSVLHEKAFKIALTLGGIAALLQPLSGDRSAKEIALHQPLKLAAAEALFQTEKPAGLLIGGIVSEKTQTVSYGLRIPRLLSFLAFGDFDAEVQGVNTALREDRPPVAIVHYAFEFMVGFGSLLAALSALALWFLRKNSPILLKKKSLWVAALCMPLGFLCMEAGWIVTEVGRQPWIIYRFVRTHEALTPMPGLVYPMMVVSGGYLLLSFMVGFLFLRQFRNVG